MRVQQQWQHGSLSSIRTRRIAETERAKREEGKNQGIHERDNTVKSNHIYLTLRFLPSQLSRQTEKEIKPSPPQNVRTAPLCSVLLLFVAFPQKWNAYRWYSSSILSPKPSPRLLRSSLSSSPHLKAHIICIMQLWKDTAFTQLLGFWSLQILVKLCE